MKLTELMNQKNVMSKEKMNVTFGGHTYSGTGCQWTSGGGGSHDCSDGHFDY